MKDRTVTEHAFPARDGKAKKPELGVLLVYSQGPMAPRAYAVRETATLGRDDEVAISVQDGGVSRTHARFTRKEGGLEVADLGSRNKTYVNGMVIPETGVFVGSGAVVRTAKTVLIVLDDVTPYLAERSSSYPALVGGAKLDDVRTRIRTIAANETSAVILGETGTGKEVVASIVHAESGRSGELVALNCAAVPPDLIDAELFGHSRGAFSGANAARAGLFRSAHRGTLFLDEIGELPLTLQAKLLRVLETSEVRAVGEDKATKVDVRVIAATNRDIDSMVVAGQFRGDLLYRLAGLRISLPTLAERVEDVPLLAAHFLEASGMEISSGAIEKLLLSPWPGNVRELKNAVLGAAAIARDRRSSEIAPEDVTAVLASPVPRASVPPIASDAELRAQIGAALERADGDVGTAANDLGMSRSWLYDALRRLNIVAKSYRRKPFRGRE